MKTGASGTSATGLTVQIAPGVDVALQPKGSVYVFPVDADAYSLTVPQVVGAIYFDAASYRALAAATVTLRVTLSTSNVSYACNIDLFDQNNLIATPAAEIAGSNQTSTSTTPASVSVDLSTPFRTITGSGLILLRRWSASYGIPINCFSAVLTVS